MTFRYLGKTFYYKLYDENEHIQKSLIKSKFIISADSPTSKKEGIKVYTPLNTVEEIYTLIGRTEKKERNFYEYRKKGQAFKPFFDLDYDIKKNGTPPLLLIENFIFWLKAVFYYLFDNHELTDEEILIYSSSNDNKLSYHIVLPYFYMKDITLMKVFRKEIYKNMKDMYKYSERLNYFDLPEETIDPAIYSNSGLFRLLHCCKKGKTNFKKPYSKHDKAKDFGLSLITNIDYEKSKEIKDYDHDAIEEEKTTEDIEDLQFSGNKEIGEDIIKFILDNLAPSRYDNYDDWIRVGFALYNSGFDFDWFDYFSEKCEKCNSKGERVYNSKDTLDFWNSLGKSNAPNKKMTYASLLYFLKIDNRKAFLSLKGKGDFHNKIVYKFQQNFNLNNLPESEKLKIDIFEERYLQPKRFQENSDILVQSYLGTGKTECLSKLKEIQDKNYNILILTNRQKLAKEFNKRFSVVKYNINCYLDYDKRNCEDIFFNRVIIQPESLWRVPLKLNYDLVILDECESIFTQFTSSTMKTRECEKNINPSIDDTHIFDRHSEFAIRWKNILKSSKKIIFSDAFLSKRTIDMYNTLSRNGTLLINNYRPQPRKAVYFPMQKVEGRKIEKMDNLINKAVEEIEKGKNIFIVCSSVAKLNNFLEEFNKHKFIGKAYSSQINSGKLLEFDCEKEWIGCQYVIITTTITTGVNFDLKHFNSVFVYFQSTPLVRDLFQSIMRVREIEDNTLYYSVSCHVFGDKFNSPDSSIYKIKNEIKERGNFITENLKNLKLMEEDESLLTIAAYNSFERSAQSYTETYEKIINTFFKMCNYEIVNEEVEEDKEEEDFENEEAKEDYYSEAFDRVMNIIPDELTYIREKMDKGTDTELDREIYALNYFIEKFNIDKTKENLKERFSLLYFLLRKNPELKGQAMRNTNFLNGSWYDPTLNSQIDPTNPKVGELCKYYVMHELCENLKMTYSPNESEEISKETVEGLSPQLLNKWAVHYFKMKDMKTVKGKKIFVDENNITKKDNIRYINYIFGSFSDCKLQKGERVRKRINGTVVDTTPYNLEFSAFIYNLSQLQKNKNTNFKMSDELKKFFEVFITL